MITNARKIALLAALSLGTVGLGAATASAATGHEASAPQPRSGCQVGVTYSGSDLLALGVNVNLLDTALLDVGLNATTAALDNSVFLCVGHGRVAYLETCVFGVASVGVGEDAYCAPDPEDSDLNVNVGITL